MRSTLTQSRRRCRHLDLVLESPRSASGHAHLGMAEGAKRCGGASDADASQHARETGPNLEKLTPPKFLHLVELSFTANRGRLAADQTAPSPALGLVVDVHPQHSAPQRPLVCSEA